MASVSRATSASWVRAASSTSAGPVDGERDPVADVEAGVATGLLDRADQVAGQALGGQLGRHRGVQHHEPAARQHRGGGVAGGVGGDGLEGVLALDERQPARP